MSTDPEVDELLGALRADLPTAEDGARLRARLAAVGVVAATATAGSAAGAATLAAQGLTVGARIAALSMGAKIAVATAVTVSVGASTVVALRPASETAPKATSTVTRATPAAHTAPLSSTMTPVAPSDIGNSSSANASPTDRWIRLVSRTCTAKPAIDR